jgi:hypothetical protein
LYKKRVIQNIKASSNACEVEQSVSERDSSPDFSGRFYRQIAKSNYFYSAARVHQPKIVFGVKRKERYQPLSLVHSSHSTLIKLKQHHVINHNPLY